MLHVRRDVPDPSLAEEALDRLNRELRAVSRCHKTLMRATDERALLEDICRIVCEEAGYRMAWASYAEDDEAKTVRPIAWAGVDGAVLAKAGVTWGDGEDGRGPIGRALRSGATVCVQDFLEAPRADAWRAKVLRQGYRSGVSLPLKRENALVFGTLNIYSNEPNAFTADEIRLLEELAEDLSFGIGVLRVRGERIHIYRKLQSNLRFFECMDRVSLAIQEANHLDEMMSEVLDATLASFGCDRAWLTYLREPDAPTWRAPLERARPEYRSALAQGSEIPTTAEMRAAATAVRAARCPVSFDPASGQGAPDALASEFGVRSMLCMAIYPKTGKAFMFGLHQCSYPRVWTEDEKALFQEIGRRLADGLTSLRAHDELRDREGQLRTLVETVPDLIWLKDLNGAYLGCNPQFERFVGVAEKDIVGKTIHELVDKELAAAVAASDAEAMAAGGLRTQEQWLTFVADGYRGLFEVTKAPMRDHSGKLIGLLGIAHDITAHARAEEQLHVAATAFEAQEGIVITDADRRILRVNKAFSEITGYSSEDVVGMTPRLLQSGRHDAAFYKAVWERIDSDGFWQGEIWNRRKSGELYPEWLNITAVKRGGAITHYVGTMMDITDRKAAETQIEHLAFYDPLTELPNRRLFQDRLEQALAGCRRSRRYGALLFIDLDNFKLLNETSGHEVGDQLLIQVAERLRVSVRAGDTVARLGGDEFVVLLEDRSEGATEAAAQAKTVGESILSALGRPYTIAGRVRHSSPSIGATVFGGTEDALDELLKQAEIAMYQAKSGGRNMLRFFDPQMQGALAARTALESELRLGVREGQFIFHYQPQVDGAGGLIGAEALLRWRHPERGLVAPGAFIPLAEETGLILPLGRWALEAACDRLAAWAADPRARALHLAVNVSARQFRQGDFVDQVREAIERSGAPAEKLKLELTESLIVEDIEDAIDKMQALRRLGVGFAMDDFGTGYSSLSYLTRLPLDQLKIDRSFVSNLPDSANDAAVVQTIIMLARSLGLAVIAEGVETEPQRGFLERLGCPTYQGFLFGAPVDLAQFERLLG